MQSQAINSNGISCFTKKKTKMMCANFRYAVSKNYGDGVLQEFHSKNPITITFLYFERICRGQKKSQ